MRYILLISVLFTLACRQPPKPVYNPPVEYAHPPDSTLASKIATYAQTLVGTPYKFGCTAPSTGFDCSGFITYVFTQFNITVPRSSVDFTSEGTPVALENSKPGDLILFTGTNIRTRTVGHIGMIVSNDSSGVSFVHSSSGKENAVIVTSLDERYKARFVKVIRLIE